MTRRSSFPVLLLSTVLASTACGGSVNDPGTGGDQDTSPIDEDTGTPGADTAVPGDDTAVPGEDTAPADGAPDPHGKPSDTYPAFPPDLPTLQYGGGTLLKSPVIVSITFNSDTHQKQFDDFGDQIGASEYWKAVTAEYGIGPAVSGASNHVHISTAPPASVTDRDVRNLIAANAGVTAGWPAATDNSIYVYYAHPSSVVASFGGRDLCKSGVGGYHSSTTVGGRRVAYAVLPQCPGGSGAFAVTSGASHELAEAVTDPFQSSPGYYGFDNPHLAWELWQQFNVENGDACEFYVDSFYNELDPAFSYAVQRQWSNANAKAGKSPCAPADPAQPYFNVSPLDLENIKVDLSSLGSSSSFPTKGYHVGVGETKTFAVGLWSESKRTAPFNLKVAEGNPVLGPASPAHLTVSIDMKNGSNGQKAFVTVTVNSAATTRYELVSIEAYVFGVAHYMPVLITQL
jgi:hypothetical protein